MKKLIYILIAVFGITLTGCEPDEVTINALTPYDGTLIAAELEMPSINSFVVTQTTDAALGNEKTQAVTLNWSPATGDNDGDIMYFLQMDIAGNKFESAVTIPLGQSGTTELSRAFTFGEINSAVNKLNANLTAIASALSVKYNEVNELEIRVESVLGASVAKAYSQAITINVTPYFSGLTNELNLKGLALADNVKLTFADGVYAGRLNLTKNTFRFFAEPADTSISYNYAYFETNGYTIDPLLENANDAEMNFKFTGNEGPWDFILNTVEKSITLVEVVAPDNLYLVGSLTGWNPATAWAFHNNGDNTFSLAVNLAADDQFKFLPTLGTWDGAWKEDPNNAGSIINEGGDPNISGYPAGQSLITVNYNTLTFEIKPIPKLYIVGSMTGWNPATSLPMSIAKTGIFSIKQSLVAGDAFKFLPTNVNWDGGFDNGKGDIKVDADGDYIISYDYTTNTFNVSKIVIPTNLYLVGSFRGWNNDAGNPKFTNTSAGVFEITQTFAANDEFKFVKSNSGGDWSNDMAESKMHSRVIEQNDEQNIKITTAGTYKVTVNFNTGTIKVVLV